jgi:hypothetical protein
LVEGHKYLSSTSPSGFSTSPTMLVRAPGFVFSSSVFSPSSSEPLSRDHPVVLYICRGTIFVCAAWSFYWSVDGSLPVLVHLLYLPCTLQFGGLVLDRTEGDRGPGDVRVDVLEDLPGRRLHKVYVRLVDLVTRGYLLYISLLLTESDRILVEVHPNRIGGSSFREYHQAFDSLADSLMCL